MGWGLPSCREIGSEKTLRMGMTKRSGCRGGGGMSTEATSVSPR